MLSRCRVTLSTVQRSVYNASREVPRHRGRYVVLTRRPSLVFRPPPPVKFGPFSNSLSRFLFSFSSMSKNNQLPGRTCWCDVCGASTWQKSVYNDTSDLSFHGQYILATRPALFHFPFVSSSVTITSSSFGFLLICCVHRSLNLHSQVQSLPLFFISLFHTGMVQSTRCYPILGCFYYRRSDRTVACQRFQLPPRYGRPDETIDAGNFPSVIQQTNDLLLGKEHYSSRVSRLSSWSSLKVDTLETCLSTLERFPAIWLICYKISTNCFKPDPSFY